MKKINLLYGRLVQLVGTPFSRKYTLIISGAKIVVDIDVLKEGLTWREIIRSKESFLSYLKKLEEKTGCILFGDLEFQSFINNLPADGFQHLMSLVNEIQTTTDALEVVKSYSELKSHEKNDFELSPNAFSVVCEIGNVSEASTIIDSFSWSASTLVGISHYFRDKGTKESIFNYYAVEQDDNEYEIAQLKALLLKGNQAVVQKGDSLVAPVLVEGDKLQEFDCALSLPPMSTNQRMRIKNDQYSRFTGLESQIGNYISPWHYVEHMLKTSRNKTIALLATGALFSIRPIDKKIRERLIEEDLIEGIIYLPNKVLNDIAINTCWVILNKHKSSHLKEKIMFIDLTESKEEITRRRCDIKVSSIQEAKLLYDNVKESDISFVVGKNWFREHSYQLDVLDAIKRERALDEVAQIPMIELSSIAQIKRGVQIPKNKMEALKGNKATHYMISLGNIQDGEIILDETSKVEPEERWKQLYELEEGDILLTSKGNVMKIAMVDKAIKNAIVTANLFCIRVNKDKYSPQVLKYYLESEKGMQFLDTLTRGTIIKSLASSDLEKLLVPKISLREQGTIIKLIERVEEDYQKDLEIANRRYQEGQASINEILGL